MFTRKSINWIIAFTLLTVVAFGNYGLPDVALATGPDTGVTDANSYISYLDSLRQKGQAEASIAQARHARNVAVFDHSSDLDALRAEAAALRMSASNPVSSGDANSYISYLDQLRTMDSPAQTDANAYISHLDQLRQKGLDNAENSPSQLVSQ
jgi:hypothetical protein